MATNTLELMREVVVQARPAARRERGRLCARCGHEVHGRFCGACGAAMKTPQPARCEWCGHERRGKFCTQCGKAAKQDTPSPVTPSPVATVTAPPPRSQPQVARPRLQTRAMARGPYPLLPDPVLAPDIFRQLYVGLGLPVGRDAIIAITSAISGEGRTTCSLGLARTLAMDQGTPVLLLEMDLERPALSSLLGLSAAPGLAEVLRGMVALEDVMQPAAENLWIVTAGTCEGVAARLLPQTRRRVPSPQLHGVAGTVILDLPPLLTTGYTPMAAEAADATVLVVRAGVTPVELVREAIARLGDRPPQGLVLNAFQPAGLGWLRHK